MLLAEFLFVLFAGLAFGSFVTCASYRLPLGQDMVVKPSYCPSCNTKLGFRDLFPVLSWLSAKGKCRHCGAKVSARYPATELVTAALFLLIYAKWGLTLPGILLALMAVALMVMVVVDFEHFIIPDQVHFVLLPLGLGYHLVMGTALLGPVQGLLLAGALGLALHYGYPLLRGKDALGFGDVKFLAVAGLWLGSPEALVPFLFFSGLFGIVTGLMWRSMKGPGIFPFGPALAAALFFCVLYPEYANIFNRIGEIIHNNLV